MLLPCHFPLIAHHLFMLFGRRFAFSFSHFCFASPLRSPGMVSTGMPLSAQNLRQSRKRASCCPVSSEISLVTFGFSATSLSSRRSVTCKQRGRAASLQCSKFPSGGHGRQK